MTLDETIKKIRARNDQEEAGQTDKDVAYFRQRGFREYDAQETAELCDARGIKRSYATILDDKLGGGAHLPHQIEELHDDFNQGVKDFSEATGLEVTQAQAYRTLKEHGDEVVGKDAYDAAQTLLLQYH